MNYENASQALKDHSNALNKEANLPNDKVHNETFERFWATRFKVLPPENKEAIGFCIVKLCGEEITRVPYDVDIIEQCELKFKAVARKAWNEAIYSKYI